ncbi:MAG: sigma-54-dependent Fis family transcriptional regulator [Planctomycetes bacterium]|nr:sigma-54-dependent Fis family transcriptional regulator [Planctomycetota bacterium]
MTAARVLVVDDEEDLRANLARFLALRGFEVEQAAGARAAIARLADADAPAIDLALVDLRLPDGSGLDVLDHVTAGAHPVQVVLMTAYASVDTAVAALRRGARDYLLKPFDLAAVAARLTALAAVSRAEGPGPFDERFPGLVARSEAMRHLLRLATEAAKSHFTLLITGESGVGKEVLARAVHDRSPRVAEPFVAVNCGALPQALVESELFGHERGAFSGAAAAKRGLFEVASGGTLFLDEVGELDQAAQVKLLRAVELKEVRRVGGTESRRVDVRIVAATNRDLRALVAERRFREDLYYRLSVFELWVPPLRERREDVVPLFEHFLARHAAALGRPAPAPSPAAVARIEAHAWPGNVRELENVAARGALLATDGVVDPEHLRLPDGPGAPVAAEVGEVEDLRAARAAFERAHIRRVLERHGGNKPRAAEALGIDLSSLYRKLERPDV